MRKIVVMKRGSVHIKYSSEASHPRPSVCVFRFDAPLIFTNVERFVAKVKKTVDEWEGIEVRQLFFGYVRVSI